MEIMCSPEAVVYDPESHEALSRHRQTRARTSAASKSGDPNELSVSMDQLNLLESNRKIYLIAPAPVAFPGPVPSPVVPKATCLIPEYPTHSESRWLQYTAFHLASYVSLCWRLSLLEPLFDRALFTRTQLEAERCLYRLLHHMPEPSPDFHPLTVADMLFETPIYLGVSKNQFESASTILQTLTDALSVFNWAVRYPLDASALQLINISRRCCTALIENTVDFLIVCNGR
ncbi:hypothetical protein C8J57DRAFT_1390317 [Mycena rebaudengoi]|nr:hypothetical protein C8J57DRAFT_1390317 [Mycena rebaudengoi]